ncbi:hypothetical protein TWF569_008961 [Orbilia oligospora]|uniref:Uncharacterized protein n=1 Tax=Orbilia oligospora TaxID=2813651 RepID=A0A7C8N7F0_ORBOL|nr:hypothetical protein TWF102_010559 [Orbilia oligospora]KAF3155592.1 hypothetical protein TWF569_008961 [Orbilia oligospora]
MHSKLYTVISLLFLYIQIPFILSGEAIPAHEEVGSTQDRIGAKHLPRDPVVPLEDLITFSRPTRPKVDRPRRVVQLNSSKFPTKPSFPPIPGFNPLKGNFIRGGLVRVVSIPPERRLTAAPIAGPLRPSIGPTQTFKISVRPIQPDIVHRQEEFENIIITPAPEPTNAFVPDDWPTSWTSWTITTRIMGIEGDLELVEMKPVVPWREPAQASPVRNGNTGPGLAETPRSSKDSVDDFVVIESPQPLAPGGGPKKEQDLPVDPGSGEVSQDTLGLDHEESQIPKQSLELIRKRDRIQKLNRRSRAMKS